MNLNEKFKRDLNGGQLGEREIALWLEKNKNHKIISFNDDNKWDILTLFNNKEIKYEVKTDNYEYYKGVITNNIFIEVRCNEKPSGIWTSQADVFVYYFEKMGIAYFIKMDDIRNTLKNNPEYFIRRSHSGDGEKVIGYTINREIHRGLFNIYKIK